MGEKPEVAKLVKSFEDGFNEKMRKTEMERAASQEKQSVENSPDHYLGAELCIRCHAEEGGAVEDDVALDGLADAGRGQEGRDARMHPLPRGGLQASRAASRVHATTPQLGNVQCENCHGMGTQHEAFASTPAMITDKTCVTCHHGENDPEFSFDKKLADDRAQQSLRRHDQEPQAQQDEPEHDEGLARLALIDASRRTRAPALL